MLMCIKLCYYCYNYWYNYYSMLIKSVNICVLNSTYSQSVINENLSQTNQRHIEAD